VSVGQWSLLVATLLKMGWGELISLSWQWVTQTCLHARHVRVRWGGGPRPMAFGVDMCHSCVPTTGRGNAGTGSSRLEDGQHGRNDGNNATRDRHASKKTRSPTLPFPNEGGLDYDTNDGS
jgi:hypothetical protein